MTRIIDRLADISGQYDALFCDLWGCLHNGRRAFPDAVAALQAFRATGGRVVLLTNSPRPAREVEAQLDGMNVPRDAYDLIVSSGDAAQAAMAAGQFGRRVYHIGPARDLPFFTAPDGTPYDVERVELAEAEGIICTGLFDDQTETPEDYRLTIATGVNRGLKLLCANPDIVVDVGEKRIFCAGAIAAAYTEAGGESFYYGKPHAPIYQLARQKLAEAGGGVEDDRILCLGDGIATDVRGGVGEGLDTLFVTGGLAASETGTIAGRPEADLLDQFLSAHSLSPTAAIGFLR
ncbi:TIGR01459 family HAD-type hydrolase [Oceanomicrobium pacificus]|uniref:TIGR01459 family HAD-type hydrolase n=1 Tax=Oceanomicrobium pacificus TaxID=2692916 RepID=A0A6B0TSC4_9RHOB|nr:TIGR01459 family HAD-type hydrolase [Oceanomicrobium pacificus]MXU64234.1 TIGR01459 family HAD-type hydrolase [Oceanomicrobium pacificus]